MRQSVDPSLRRLTEWLAQAVDGHVMLVNSDGGPLGQSSDSAHTAFTSVGDAIAQATIGKEKVTELTGRNVIVRLHSIGSEAPHPVLATARTAPYAPHVASVLSQVADFLALLMPQLHVDNRWNTVHQAAVQVHGSILQLLLSGQATVARRAAGVLAPTRWPTPSACASWTAPPRAATTPRGSSGTNCAYHPRPERPCPRRSRTSSTAPSWPLPRLPQPPHHRRARPRHTPPGTGSRAGRRHAAPDHRRTPRPLPRNQRRHGSAHADDAYRNATRALNTARYARDRIWEYSDGEELAAVLPKKRFMPGRGNSSGRCTPCPAPNARASPPPPAWPWHTPTLK
ncbi:hypothetical protein NKH77_16890 [Streptomyces sp. M19]